MSFKLIANIIDIIILSFYIIIIVHIEISSIVLTLKLHN